MPVILYRFSWIFQSTLPRGSDLYLAIVVKNYLYFNPRSLAGATDIIHLHQLQTIRFQSTLPRGSDDMYWPTFAFLGISIHAPSRERLFARFLACLYNSISIHAPSRERRDQCVL